MVTRGLCFCDVIRRIALFNSPFDDKLVVLKINSYQNTHERKKNQAYVHRKYIHISNFNQSDSINEMLGDNAHFYFFSTLNVSFTKN